MLEIKIVSICMNRKSITMNGIKIISIQLLKDQKKNKTKKLGKKP